MVINFIDNIFFLMGKFNLRNNGKYGKIVIIFYESFTLNFKEESVFNKIENMIVIT